MATVIDAIYNGKKYQDSGRDQSPDYYVYVFNRITDNEGAKYGSKWFKETKLLQSVRFEKGKKYKITLSEKPYSFDSIKLPYPIEISWDEGKVYLKNGNSIVKVNADNTEKNLSVPLNKLLGTSNDEIAALNKLGKGTLTKELLQRINLRGTFFFVHHYDPQDKRKGRQISRYGLSVDAVKGNFVLVQKETRTEIDEDLKKIKTLYLNKSIVRFFNFVTELLPPKKGK